MRIVLLLGLAALIGGPATASDKPAYFGNVKGTLVSGLTERHQFAFTPGTLTFCERKDVSMLSRFSCDLDGTSAAVTDERGKRITVRFDKLHAFYKSHQGGPFHEYNFVGRLEEKSPAVGLSTEVRLVMWYYTATPAEINGSMQLSRYGISAGLQAARE